MQNKLLYLSWLPPFSRSDKISDYEAECRPVRWKEKQIRSLDGTKLAICEGHIPVSESAKATFASSTQRKSVVICYFQGNGGSTPLRLPLLSQILRSLASTSSSRSSVDYGTKYTIVALSYRGYWTSSGRATQSGIQLDAQAFLTWVSDTYSNPDCGLQVVLWGHSLGSAVATSALTPYLSRQGTEQNATRNQLAPVTGVIMEAPTSNIKDMLISLYPQRWLPYRYLWPFSWNTWCNFTALEQLATWRDRAHDQSKMDEGETEVATRSKLPVVPPILILSAAQDEVIPPYVAGQIERKGLELGLAITGHEVQGAMHTEAPLKPGGRDALVQFILRVGNGRSHNG